MPLRQQHTELLVEGTVAGTAYRKLLCYDLTKVGNLRILKTCVLDDLKAAGAPLESASEVVLRNYVLTDYEHTPFGSAGAKSCALSDQDSWGPSHGKGCRLLAAAPSPRVPIGRADDSRHAMLAIASRQLYDRACGEGFILPLEARVKPAATRANAGEAQAAVVAPADPADSSSSGAQAPAPRGRGGVESQPFDITVRDFRGRHQTVRVCGCTYVSLLKAGIAAALGCSVYSHWRLFYDGRPLDDELDLADYNITAGALVEVQMTSHQPNRLKQGPAAHSGVASDEGKDPASGIGSGAGGGGRGGGSGGGAKAAGPAPNCSAPWANSSVKATATAQMTVQVLLPCGRVAQVNRFASEEVQRFVHRLLEAEKALLLAPTEDAPALGAAAAGVAVPGVAPQPVNATSGCGKELLLPAPHQAARNGLRAPGSVGQLQGGVIGQKLLAVLLAAAAVVMAMAVL
ncbi:hypothetical protein PLESTB_000081500 [Pleodorina starrii]|uniref:Ubiquitin-like domain-containing protein n=1 Tax=Pleodorina starrii TaxID=330485 RepID=A0A9W6BA60_9CHLO|nr:hypothetical protein PLESTM_000077900 [Pleodorina starrii]GLC48303.1 hypothetical protein PLESTB_000081500 [Pleodorina starrii]GLC66588.1 hypothetical protein PLESTF_000447300 [Pleodorina starrii]